MTYSKPSDAFDNQTSRFSSVEPRTRRLLFAMADYAYVLERGRIVVEGKPADLAEAPAVVEHVLQGPSPCTLASSRL